MTDEPVAIIVGADAGSVGALVADLQARGVRTGAFVGDAATATATRSSR